MPKSEYNSKLEEIKGLGAQITERDKQLETLKNGADGNEALMAKATGTQTQTCRELP